MADLKDFRQEIDQIDDQLIPLLERRMRVVSQVAAYKQAHGLPVLQQGRERVVLERAVERLEDKSLATEAIRFMESVMAVSRAAQRRQMGSEPLPRRQHPLSGPAAFYGEAGSFSEQALIEYFGPQRERVACPEFEDVCKALQAGQVDYGVLPIENSSTGAISQVYDLLGKYGFYIVGERRVAISQNLVGLPGTSLSQIQRVYSHPQGIEQSGGFLGEHPSWNLLPYHSTAASAKKVALDKDPSQAAIASVHAARLYGLEVLAPDIQDNQQNTTRFIIIGRELQPERADKVSLMFSLDNQSGTLYNTLRYFADRNINLVKIESRPIPNELWNYLFYVDFEGDLDSQEVREALSSLTSSSERYRLLGAYQSDRGQEK